VCEVTNGRARRDTAELEARVAQFLVTVEDIGDGFAYQEEV
jgi:hypothetical protein